VREDFWMRFRTTSILGIFATSLALLVPGCGSGTDIQVAKPEGEVKPSAPIKPEELKGDAKRAVGPGTSANIGKLGKNPMELSK
jgi:hypothetical protein